MVYQYISLQQTDSQPAVHVGVTSKCVNYDVPPVNWLPVCHIVICKIY